MRRLKHGFTLVEVSLFLALTAMLFVGIAAGVQNSIYQQRFNDAVQNFAEFLRTAYSQVLNVQSEGEGRTDQAIYGKLVTFNVDDEEKNIINTYNVIGDVSDSIGTGKALELLKDLNGNIVKTVESEDGLEPKKVSVGFVEQYAPRWGSAIQFDDAAGDPKASFVGALLIIRHPLSGTIYTYTTNQRVDKTTFSDILNKEAEAPEAFKIKAVDFCINPNGPNEGGVRRDVRVITNARNASGVEIIPDSDSKCGRI